MISHLAIIMDGNRRWAKKRSLTPWKGHQQGVNIVKLVIEYCLESSIAVLSLYTFSLENFQKRSLQEQNFLFDIIIDQSEKIIDDLIKNGVCLRFIGDSSYFPEHVKPAISKLELATKDGKKLFLNILFCYGGRQEIVQAVKALVSDIQIEKISASVTVDETLFKKYLWTSALPDPDIVIRTGGIKRLSNFLLFQAAYSELFFLDCLWPDLTKENLAQTVQEFHLRQRNFGA